MSASPEIVMAAIDYEAEYNNRARVPDHAAHIAGWERDAKAYREQMSAADGRAELGIPYGASQRQFLDLFFPEETAGASVALFIHGGYWRALEPRSFSHMARGLNQRGAIVAVAGYDLCPHVQIADIVEQIRKTCLFLWQRFTRRILVYGHSAGGHLAACMLATDWKILDPTAPDDLVPAAYSISGLFDLAPLVGISMNQDLRLTEEEARRLSPLFWPVAAGRVLDAVVGGAESSEFLRQSRIIVEAWRQGRAETRYEEIPGENHFSVLAPLADAKSPMVERLAELAKRVQSGLITAQNQ
jgi:arylformamidase